MRNQLFLITFSFFSFLNIFSQSRENTEKSLIINQFIKWKTGNDINGWEFNDGEWKSRLGYLSTGENKSFVELYEKYNDFRTAKSYSKQNFEEIGVLSLTYKGQKYIGLGIKSLDGRYKYPTINKDWIVYENYYIFVFTLDEISKLLTLENELVLKPNYGTYGNLSEIEKKYESCYENLNFLFSNGISYDKWVFNVKKTKSEDKDVFRFLLPIKTNYKKNLIDFNNNYFEVSITEFNLLLDLIKTLN